MSRIRTILFLFVAVSCLIVEVVMLRGIPTLNLLVIVISSFLLGAMIGVSGLLGLHMRRAGVTVGRILVVSLLLLFVAFIASAGIFLTPGPSSKQQHRVHAIGLLGGTAAIMPLALRIEQRMKKRTSQ